MHWIARLAPLATLAALVPALALANHSAPATYNGTSSAGGTISFDVSADGNSIPRFERSGVTLSCGPSGSTTTDPSFAITNHTFSYTPATGTQIHGSFPSPGQASGTLSYKGPGCTSSAVTWTATTTAPPPGPPPPPTGPPPPGPPPPPGGPPPPSGPDLTPPTIELTAGHTRLRRPRLKFGVNCPNEPCAAVRVQAVMSVPGAAATYRLGPVVVTKTPARVTLKMSPKAFRHARAALRKGKTVKMKVTAIASDAAGNRRTKSRTIRMLR